MKKQLVQFSAQTILYFSLKQQSEMIYAYFHFIRAPLKAQW